VFLYAVGAEHHLKAPCSAILRALGAGTLDATTSTEVVQEVLFVICRRGMKDAAVQAATGVLSLFPHVLPVTGQDMLLACDIYGRTDKIPPRDAVHAATMINNGLVAIISADRDFDRIDGLVRMDPADMHGHVTK